MYNRLIVRLNFIKHNNIAIMFNSNWYFNLVKPYLVPPNWLFRSVWTILYCTILASFILYYRKSFFNKKTGYIYFSIQLLLNLIWTPVFFGMKNIFLGFVIISLLDIFIFLTIKKFYSVSKISAYLLIPYFLWTLFATYLNIGYLLLN